MPGLSSGFLHTITVNQEEKYSKLQGIVSTYAGMPGVAGSKDGAFASQGSPNFYNNSDLAVIGGSIYCGVYDSLGNFYAVLDTHCIKKISSNGVVSDFISTPASAGDYLDGTGTACKINSTFFKNPNQHSNITIDPNTDEIFIVQGYAIKKIDTKTGVMTTILGNVVTTPAGTVSPCDDGINARFRTIVGVFCDNNSILYVWESYTNTIAGTYVSHIKKFKTNGDFIDVYIDNIATAGLSNSVAVTQNSTINNPSTTHDCLVDLNLSLVYANIGGFNNKLFCVDSLGNIYFPYRYCIKKLSTTGEVTILAGDPNLSGTVDATKYQARFNGIFRHFTIDSNNNIYVSLINSTTNQSIYNIIKITPSGVVTTIFASRSRVYSMWCRQSDNKLFIIENSTKLIIKQINLNDLSETLYYTMSLVDFSGSPYYLNDICGDSNNNLYISTYKPVAVGTTTTYKSLIAKIPAPVSPNTVPTANSDTLYYTIASSTTYNSTADGILSFTIDSNNNLYVARGGQIIKINYSSGASSTTSSVLFGNIVATASPFNYSTYPATINTLGVISTIIHKNNKIIILDINPTANRLGRLNSYDLSTNVCSVIFGSPGILSNMNISGVHPTRRPNNYYNILFDDDNTPYITCDFIDSSNNDYVRYRKISKTGRGVSTDLFSDVSVSSYLKYQPNTAYGVINSFSGGFIFDKFNKIFIHRVINNNSNNRLSPNTTTILYSNYYYKKDNSVVYYKNEDFSSENTTAGTLKGNLSYILSNNSSSSGNFYRGNFYYGTFWDNLGFGINLSPVSYALINSTKLTKGYISNINSNNLIDSKELTLKNSILEDKNGILIDLQNSGNSFCCINQIGFDSNDNLYVNDINCKIRKIDTSKNCSVFVNSFGHAMNFTKDSNIYRYIPNNLIFNSANDLMYTVSDSYSNHKIKRTSGIVDTINQSIYRYFDFFIDKNNNVYMNVRTRASGTSNAILTDIYKFAFGSSTTPNFILTLSGEYAGSLPYGLGICRMCVNDIGDIFYIQLLKPASQTTTADLATFNTAVPIKNNTIIYKIANGTTTSKAYCIIQGDLDTTINSFVVDSTGIFYVSCMDHNIYKIRPSGSCSLLAGSGSAGSSDGTGSSASFNVPTTLALNSLNELFVIDSFNDTIRKIV